MRVLITGAGGQVAAAACALAPAEAQVTARSRSELDISDREAVDETVGALAPDVIINAAAFTAVDRAESESALATAVNTAGAENLARAAARQPARRLLHISTDYVFDGSLRRPYRTTDPTSPLGVYGRSKRDGERAVLRALPERTVVLRTAWVYAPRGHNFLLTMLRLMREKGAVRVVSDQVGSPTAVASIARVLWRFVAVPAHGIFHWTDEGVTSWYEFARAIASEGSAMGLVGERVSVEPITTEEYPTAARRPQYSVLDCSETSALLGVAPVPWRETLRATLQSLAASRTAQA